MGHSTPSNAIVSIARPKILNSPTHANPRSTPRAPLRDPHVPLVDPRARRCWRQSQQRLRQPPRIPAEPREVTQRHYRVPVGQRVCHRRRMDRLAVKRSWGYHLEERRDARRQNLSRLWDVSIKSSVDL